MTTNALGPAVGNGKVAQDLGIVLGVDLLQAPGAVLLQPVGVGLGTKIQHLVPGELQREEEKGNLTEGRLHPVPGPCTDFQPRLEIFRLGNLGRHCAIVAIKGQISRALRSMAELLRGRGWCERNGDERKGEGGKKEALGSSPKCSLNHNAVSRWKTRGMEARPAVTAMPRPIL
jgi:hypothetical protein